MPASPSVGFVAGSNGNSTVPAGKVRPPGVVNCASASFAVRPLPSSELSVRTAVAELIASA